MVAHAAIRGDGSVSERVCMRRDPDSSEGVLNRAAETDGMHSLQHDRLTREKLHALSVPLNQAVFSTSFGGSHWPTQSLDNQLSQG